MPTINRFYSSTATTTALTAGVSPSAGTLPVAATTGFPTSYPYTLIVDRGTASEEVVNVTGASGLSLAVDRGADGTTGLAHTISATVEHGVSARDFREPQQHIAATTNVHGITGSVVGTTDTQTLSNKTLSAPVITGTATIGPSLTVTGVASCTELVVNGDPATGNFVFLGDRTTDVSNPGAGQGFLYSKGGALFWRGSNGNITQIAPA